MPKCTWLAVVAALSLTLGCNQQPETKGTSSHTPAGSAQTVSTPGQQGSGMGGGTEVPEQAATEGTTETPAAAEEPKPAEEPKAAEENKPANEAPASEKPEGEAASDKSK
jgi:hypothetical protein